MYTFTFLLLVFLWDLLLVFQWESNFSVCVSEGGGRIK